jgi:hypothetical protein
MVQKTRNLNHTEDREDDKKDNTRISNQRISQD